MKLEDKIQIVKENLKDKNVAIGFSGGSDSTLIAYLSSKVAKDTFAITIDNHLMPTGFIEYTKRTCELFDIRHEIIDMDFFDNEDFLKNDSTRCYNCRNSMYEQIKEIALKNGFDYICDGNNISDLVYDRPGILITYEKEFRTPLIDARLTSREVHEYLDKNNIAYSKSTTCLATRIPTNTPINKSKIELIDKCEDYIYNNTNCKIVKVRDFGEVSICEVDDISEILNENKFNQIDDALKSYGFKKITLNLSPIKDNEDIVIDYDNCSFSHQLPFTIDLENTKKINKNAEIIDKTTIQLGNITICENGLIKGNNFKNYKTALDEFSEILPKLRRNI